MHQENRVKITREIGIDMGHRVMLHGSKCRHVHGHRYKIIAEVTGPLYSEGEQTGMVMDFGFLKNDMMEVIDAYCDHGFAIWIMDTAVLKMFFSPVAGDSSPEEEQFETWIKTVKADINRQGYYSNTGDNSDAPVVFGSKIFVMKNVPTAENLASLWGELLNMAVKSYTDNQAYLSKITVWETPNCSAEYTT